MVGPRVDSRYALCVCIVDRMRYCKIHIWFHNTDYSIIIYRVI